MARPSFPEKTEPSKDAIVVSGGLRRWARRWMELGAYSGPHLPEPSTKIQQVLDLWDEPIPGNWERGFDSQLIGTRYRRGDSARPHPGEHTIEYEILCTHFEEICCLGGRLVDGINALPLVRDSGGGRLGNVEADLLLLVEKAGSYQLVLCEIKHSSNTAWYAAIENLRQLRLSQLSSTARQVFHHRRPDLPLPQDLPLVGLVLAPTEYYVRSGQKANAVPHAVRLLKTFNAKTKIECSLATWCSETRTIEVLPAMAGD